MAANQDCVGILMLNGGGRFTAPFGGTGRRVDRVYLPGEIEWETRKKREAEGIFVEDETWDRMCEVAEEVGVPLLDGA